MYTATLSMKNQITIPKFLLDMINAKSGIQFLISEKDEALTMKPIKTSIVDELAGSVIIPKNKMGVPFEKIRNIMAQKTAYDTINS